MSCSRHPSILTVAWEIVRTDLLVKLALALFVALTLFFVAPLPQTAHRFVPFHQYSSTLLLVLALVALRLGLNRIARRDERRFWNDLTLAYAAWLATEILLLPYSHYAAPLAANLVCEVGYALYYVALVLAVERRPDRREKTPQTGLERLLKWPAIAACILGLLVYFILIPGFVNPEIYQTFVPSTYLYLILDGYLAVRFLHISRTTHSLRWKAIYGLVALSLVLSILSSFESRLYFTGDLGALEAPILWKLVIVSFILAVRTRHATFPEELLAEEPESEVMPQGQMLVFALIFPLIHFALYAGGVLDEPSKPAREVMIVIWLLLIGSIAILQYRFLESRKKELEVGHSALSEEITSRRQAEEDKERLIAALEVKNAELERFTYTVSHDLKSPLFTIQGFLGMLEKDLAAGNVERMGGDLGRIRSASDKMRRLLDDLLKLSRVGRVAQTLQRVDLRKLAHEAADQVAGSITERGVEVAISAELPTVLGDRSQLLAVFQNLIENAVRFMNDQEKPKVEITTRQDQGAAVYLVRDNGRGIEPHDHERVFELFRRLDTDTEGTGIGLALVKRIVEVHGGRIWVESAGLGKGSTFCFNLMTTSDTATQGSLSHE